MTASLENPLRVVPTNVVSAGFLAEERSVVRDRRRNLLEPERQSPLQRRAERRHFFRFEVHPDDLWKPGGTTSERSEIRGETVYQPGDVLDVSYGFMIEPGPANTATGRGGAGDWLIVGQFHADDYESQPPFAIEMLGEKMAIIIRYGDPANSRYRELYVDSQPIERGHYYDMRIEVRFENNGNGFLHVWRDGEEIVNYSGPLGYDNGVYWKYGIYRSETDTKIAVNYKSDMSFHKEGDADGVIVVGTPAGDQITNSTTPAGQPALTNDGDTIKGGGGSNVVAAGNGNDKVIGSKGNDVLTGGNGNDLINGGAGNDKLFGAEANDKMLGRRARTWSSVRLRAVPARTPSSSPPDSETTRSSTSRSAKT